MGPVVKLSFGERFLNWYPHHTKLYLRGQQGKDWPEQRRLDVELAASINDWAGGIEREAYLRGLREAHLAANSIESPWADGALFDGLRAIDRLIAKAEAERGDSDGG